MLHRPPQRPMQSSITPIFACRPGTVVRLLRRIPRDFQRKGRWVVSWGGPKVPVGHCYLRAISRGRGAGLFEKKTTAARAQKQVVSRETERTRGWGDGGCCSVSGERSKGRLCDSQKPACARDLSARRKLCVTPARAQKIGHVVRGNGIRLC